MFHTRASTAAAADAAAIEKRTNIPAASTKKWNEINERDTLSQARHLRLINRLQVARKRELLIPIFYAHDESFH